MYYTYIYIYIYIYVYKYADVAASVHSAHTRACCYKRELDYSVPRLHYPVSSRRFRPEIVGDFGKSKTSFLCVFAENHFLIFAEIDNTTNLYIAILREYLGIVLPSAPVYFRRKPEPVPPTQVLSYAVPNVIVILTYIMLVLLYHSILYHIDIYIYI